MALVTDARATHSVAGLITVAVGAMLTVAEAGAVEVVPRLSAGLIYSDNLFLAPQGQEQDDFITFLQPGIGISSVGQRYDFYLDYSLRSFFYADASDSNATFSNGLTKLEVQIVPENLIVTGVAAISQTIIDPQGQIPFSNLPVTGNLQDLTELRVTPEWRQRLLSSDLRLAATVGRLAFEQEGLQDIDYLEFNNAWTGPERERGVTWALSHFYGAYDYDVVEIKRQQVDLFLYAELGSGWAPFVSVGVESDFAEPTQSDLDYFTWSAGLRRTTERSSAEVSYGDRSFGSNLRVLVERRFGGDAGDYIQLSYSEAPQTPANVQGVQLPGQLPPVTQPPVLEPGLPRGQPPPILPPGVGQSFLTRRGQLVLASNFIRSSISLTVFTEDFKSVPFDTDPSEILNRNKQDGLAGTYTFRFGQRLSLRATAQVADREFETNGVVTSGDTLINGRLGLDYQLGEKTSVSTWIGTDRQQNPTGQAITREYEQNVAGILITRTFL